MFRVRKAFYLCIVFDSIVMLHFRKCDSHFSSYTHKHSHSIQLLGYFMCRFRFFLSFFSDRHFVHSIHLLSVSLTFCSRLCLNALLFGFFKSYCNSFINFRLLLLLSFFGEMESGVRECRRVIIFFSLFCAYRISFVRSFIQFTYYFFC